MSTVAQEHEQMRRPSCWCCGNGFDEQDLTRLGSHPEVGVCAGCARWLDRRARVTAEVDTHTPGAAVRRSAPATRAWVVRAGLHDWPVLGSLLRRLDRHVF